MDTPSWPRFYSSIEFGMAAKQGGETFGCGRCGTKNHGNDRDILVFLADMDIWDMSKNWVYPKKPKTMATLW